MAAVSCQACAVPPCTKFARVIVVGVLTDKDLAIAITVSALSAERWAAKAATASGFGVVADTLVSPNVDPLPS